MLNPQGIGAKTGIAAQPFLAAEHECEASPKRLGANSNYEMSAITTPKYLVRHDTGMSVAPPSWRLVSVQVVAADVASQVSWQSNNAMSRNCPRPDFSLASSAAMMPTAE